MSLRAFAATLPKVTKAILEKGGHDYAALVAEWHLIVGPALAGSSLPEKLARRRPIGDSANAPLGGTLTIRVTSGAAMEFQHREPQMIERLWENTRFFKAGLQQLGFNTGASESPITPVIAGEAARAMKLSDRLFQEGVFAQGIGFPTVAKDKARVRTIVTATHTREELQFALDAFAKVGRELGLI